MKRSFHLLAAFALSSGLAASTGAQSSPYPAANLPKLYEDLLAKIDAIPIYDNHAHPGFADDSDVDAMASPPTKAVLRLRDDNPEFVTAAKSLSATPTTTSSLERPMARRSQSRRTVRRPLTSTVSSIN
jgi:hypothetical protein